MRKIVLVGHACRFPLEFALFLLALALSAVMVPQLLNLHLLQALIYQAVFLLTRRNSPWGYGIGVIVPTVWNSLNLLVTHLFQKEFWSLLRIGHVSRPETMTVMVGGVAHFLVIIACMAGFLQLRPRRKQWG
jgi:hypothetical protein